MADTKISAKTEATSILSTDEFVVVVDPASSPATRRIYMGNMLAGGWINVATWSYASPTTINVPAGAASIHSVGDKIRIKQGGSYKYFYGTAVADTLLTVFAGSDYTVANAAITEPGYSKASNPLLFPQWFNYAHGWASSGTAPVLGDGVAIARSVLLGRLCRFGLQLTMGASTTYGTGTYTFALPATVGASAGPSAAILNLYDSNVTGRYVRFVNLPAGSTTIGAVWGTAEPFTGAALSPTVPFTWAAGDILRIDGSYEI